MLYRSSRSDNLGKADARRQARPSSTGLCPTDAHRAAAAEQIRDFRPCSRRGCAYILPWRALDLSGRSRSRTVLQWRQGKGKPASSANSSLPNVRFPPIPDIKHQIGSNGSSRPNSGQSPYPGVSAVRVNTSSSASNHIAPSSPYTKANPCFVVAAEYAAATANAKPDSQAICHPAPQTTPNSSCAMENATAPAISAAMHRRNGVGASAKALTFRYLDSHRSTRTG